MQRNSANYVLRDEPIVPFCSARFHFVPGVVVNKLVFVLSVEKREELYGEDNEKGSNGITNLEYSDLWWWFTTATGISVDKRSFGIWELVLPGFSFRYLKSAEDYVSRCFSNIKINTAYHSYNEKKSLKIQIHSFELNEWSSVNA